MQLALAHGQRGLGRTWPNPSVACLVVDNHRLLSRGRTGNGGRPHAEAVALAGAGAAADGSTAYVTLEPCSHTGQTPPCTDALVAAGIGRVVVAVADPDHRVSGAGLERLRSSGVRVTIGCESETSIRSHLGFFLARTVGRPAVTVKLASSIDGRVATQTGDSRWISGEQSRRMVHVMRASHDAVMVGSGTARSDNPNLLPRHAGVGHMPVRIVIDTDLSTPADCELGRTARTGPVWICHGPGAADENRRRWRALGAELSECRNSPAGLDLAQAMSRLADRGLTRILCEGGPELATSLVRDGLVDCLVGFSAGMLIGEDGRAMLGSLGVAEVRDGPEFPLNQLREIGGDTLAIWARPIHSYDFA